MNPFDAQKGWVLSKWVTTPASVVPESARYPFMVQSGEVNHAEIHGNITHSVQYTEAMHSAHYPAMFISLFVAILGIFIAYMFYSKKKIDTDKLAGSLGPVYKFSLNKWYFDEFYQAVFVNGTIGLTLVLNWFDKYIVDGIVNGSAALTRMFSSISGFFDTYVVDGLVNFTAYFSGFVGIILRKFQTGKVQTYLILTVFSVLIIVLMYVNYL